MRHAGLRLIIAFILVFAGVLAVSGCASMFNHLGPPFKTPQSAPDNMGVIYIYRQVSLFGSGVVSSVKEGESAIVNIYDGGYYPYVVTPGTHELWTMSHDKDVAVTLDVKAGDIYYVRAKFDNGIYLTLVAPDVAKKEIVGCKLIPQGKKDQVLFRM